MKFAIAAAGVTAAVANLPLVSAQEMLGGEVANRYLASQTLQSMSYGAVWGTFGKASKGPSE